jgi:branched-chain amino acid transport system ATP-binding protein
MSRSADAHSGPREAIGLRSVSSGYGQTIVLREISMSIAAGSTVAVLGANGAGKTTLLRTISGVLKPSAGAIEISGVDARNVGPARRVAGGLCYIPEGRAVFRSLSVRENIIVQCKPPSSPAEAVDLVVDTFPALRNRLRQHAGTLSGGEQQMLAIARAYVQNPTTILVDEASLGLAPRIVDEVFVSLRRLSARGITLVIVDQFAKLALEMATVAHVLRRGEMVYSGDPKRLLDGDLFERYMGSRRSGPSASDG